VHLFFDESGDFGFPPDRFDSSVQAGVVCPDSFLDELRRFVDERHDKWEVTELHATGLTAGQRLTLCRFIANSPLELVAYATDTELADRDAIQQWRLAQAAAMRRNLDWYREQGGRAADVEKWMDTRMSRSALASRISDTEFIQAVLFVSVIFAALQKSLVFFSGDRWRPDFHRFAFILDAKLPNKLGAGEKFLRESIVPILGSNARFRLEMVDTWKDADPPHPFIERFERTGGWSGVQRTRTAEDAIDLSGIFEDGLRFEQSHRHPGLQIADVVAYVTRYAVLHPQDDQAQLAFALIRDKLRYRHGRALQLVRLSTSGRSDGADRYRHLH
jgi:Protein of unknown function (DUF3800)